MDNEPVEAKRLVELVSELSQNVERPVPTTREELEKWIKFCALKLQTDEKEYKVVRDAVHGHIKLHPLCVAIMDTPQFQRLRDIKQLGGVCYVYPGGSHSRFEHSLGVCHLAGRMAKALQERQPDLDITDKDVLCVEIAGLCHDLGHGPFSHVFDMTFIQGHLGQDWEHEKASCDMIDFMLKAELDTDLEGEFHKYGLQDEDIEFIKALIKGKKDETNDGGRPATKNFLYEIVANKRNGVDVDRWDYFLRDCHHLGMRTDFDHERMINSARVIKADVKGEKVQQICWRDKDQFNVYELFHTRYTLHRRVYQHKVVKAVELMIVEALAKVDKILTVTGEIRRSLSGSILDMKAYSKLTDSVFYQILNFDEAQLNYYAENGQPRTDSAALKDQLRGAQKLLKNIERRKLYKCVAESQPTEHVLPNTEKIKEEIIKMMGSQDLKDRIRVMIAKLDMGKAEESQMCFYSKNDPKTATPADVQQISILAIPQKTGEGAVCPGLSCAFR